MAAVDSKVGPSLAHIFQVRRLQLLYRTSHRAGKRRSSKLRHCLQRNATSADIITMIEALSCKGPEMPLLPKDRILWKSLPR